MCFEFVFGHFLLKKVKSKKKKLNKLNVLICKETNAHTKTNARGSLETNLFFNLPNVINLTMRQVV